MKNGFSVESRLLFYRKVLHKHALKLCDIVNRKHLITNMICETHIRWLAHVQCKSAKAVVRIYLTMQVDNPPRERGMLKRTCMEMIEIDMKTCNLFEDLT